MQKWVRRGVAGRYSILVQILRGINVIRMEKRKPSLVPIVTKNIVIKPDLENIGDEKGKSFDTHANICGEKLVAEDKLKVQIDKHNNNKSHICPVCQKGFRFSSKAKSNICVFQVSG